MPTRINTPTIVPAAGNPPKMIEEFVRRVNTGTAAVSIAQMKSPQGWSEPGQSPDFDEYTVVLAGTLRVEYEGGNLEISAGQAIIAHRGEWVRYSTPHPGGAEYIAVCLPAFLVDTVHRDNINDR
jgi:quercetin dioxygenase-like cupin family protein